MVPKKSPDNIIYNILRFSGWLSKNRDENPRTLDGHFELKIMRMRGFSSRFLDNQPENLSNTIDDHITIQFNSIQGPVGIWIKNQKSLEKEHK